MASVVGITSAISWRANALFRGTPSRSRRTPEPQGGANRSNPALATLVEAEIIPRLMLASSTAPLPIAATGVVPVGTVDSFAPLTLDVDAGQLLARVDGLLADGISVESLFIDLLAPTARRLGEWWEDDRCDFIEVTMGLWRLQEVVREVALKVPARAHPLDHRRTALFAAMPGDQHGFGAVLIDETFRRAGWNSEVAVGLGLSELLGRVGSSRFDLVGLTVSGECHIARLPSIITAMRSVSANPALRVMVGGWIFVENPKLALDVGADGTAPDAPKAVLLAEELIGERIGEIAACG